MSSDSSPEPLFVGAATASGPADSEMELWSVGHLRLSIDRRLQALVTTMDRAPHILRQAMA